MTSVEQVITFLSVSLFEIQIVEGRRRRRRRRETEKEREREKEEKRECSIFDLLK